MSVRAFFGPGNCLVSSVGLRVTHLKGQKGVEIDKVSEKEGASLQEGPGFKWFQCSIASLEINTNVVCFSISQLQAPPIEPAPAEPGPEPAAAQPVEAQKESPPEGNARRT